MVEHTGIAAEPYCFRNSSQTIVTISQRVKIDFFSVLFKLEEKGVPFSYTNGLEEIRLTTLPQDEGNYLRGVIQLHALGVPSQWRIDAIAQTLIHEIGHFLDEHEAISSDPSIIKEKRTHARFLPDRNARKNVDEYVAYGFEVFYFGTKEQKKQMRKHNKKLHGRIAQVHRKYRSK